MRVERMSRNVKTERFFFSRQHFDKRPRLHVSSQLHFARHGSWTQAEQIVLAECLCASLS